MTRVMFGCPIANREWAVKPWFDHVRDAAETAGVDWEVVFLFTKSEDNTEEELMHLRYGPYNKQVTILEGPPVSRRPAQIASHMWQGPGTDWDHYDYMASMRNTLLHYADVGGYDYFFSLDSDIMLPWIGLHVLLEALGDIKAEAIAPLVNLAEPPNTAYNYMWYHDEPMVFDRKPPGGTVYGHLQGGMHPFYVDSIMAAMLIARSAFQVKWKSAGQGEDIGWAENALQAGIEMLVDPTITCEHWMKGPPE